MKIGKFAKIIDVDEGHVLVYISQHEEKEDWITIHQIVSLGDFAEIQADIAISMLPLPETTAEQVLNLYNEEQARKAVSMVINMVVEDGEQNDIL